MIFFSILYQSHVLRESSCDMNQVREPVWAWLREHCPSFTTMSADAVFSDIFRINTVGDMTDELKSLFLIDQRNLSTCSLCNNLIERHTNIFVLYITCENLVSEKLENYVCEAILPISSALYCDICHEHSGSISTLQHFVSLPTFLTIERSSNCISRVIFPQNLDVSVCYSLKAIVRCMNHHFTVAIKETSHWLYIDDLCFSVRQYSSLSGLFNKHCNGWFFAVYEKCSFALNNSDTPRNSTVLETPCVDTQDKCETISRSGTQREVNASQTQTTSDKQSKSSKRTEYMRMYRKKRKCDKQTADADNTKRNKQKLYMWEYRKKIKCNEETKDVDNAKVEKKNLYTREYRKKRKCNNETKDEDNAKKIHEGI